MPQPTSWKDLGVGLLAAGLVIGGALAILVFGRVGTLKGKTFKLYVTSDAARGLIKGSEVWLDGQRVGLVKRVDFAPAASSQKDRLVIVLDVLDQARGHVRADTRVQIRAGLSLIGDKVVYLTSGSTKAAALADGDTLHSEEQADMEGMASDAALAAKEFPGILANVKLLASQLETTKSTIGALGADTRGLNLSAVKGRASRVMDRVSNPEGSIGLALNGRADLQARAVRAMARVDSVRALVTSDAHSVGRFRRDSTLLLEVKRLREEVAAVQRLAADPTGTIGRVRTDSAIVRAIHRDLESLDSLVANIKKHPLRYIAF